MSEEGPDGLRTILLAWGLLLAGFVAAPFIKVWKWARGES